MWGDVGMSAGGGGHLKLESGETVSIHVLGEAEGAPSEPKSYFSYFNQAVQRGVVLPDGFKDSSIRVAAKHSILVWSYKDEAVRIWSMGNTVAAQLKGVMEAYDGSLADVDIVLKRIGNDKKTKYLLTPRQPSKFDASVLEGVELPDLEVVFAANSEDEIEGLKNGVVPDGDGGTPAEASAEETAAAEAQAIADAEAEAGATTDETGEEDEAAALEAKLAALKAKKAGAKPAPAKTAPPKTAAKPAPAKAAGGDARLALIKSITHAFATNAKYKTPAARIAFIKQVTKKLTLSVCTLPELQTLKAKIK